MSITSMHTNDYDLSDYNYFKVTIGGKVLQLTAMKAKPKGGNHIKNISADEYLIVRTGEIKQRNRNSSVNSYYTWRRRAKNLIMLINNNFSSQNNEVFITLTYAECMTDYARCQKDFKSFIEKLIYHYPDSMYLAIPELQERGTWHVHALVKSPRSQSLFIAKDDINKWWAQGQTDIKRITDAENIGKYFISHGKLKTTAEYLLSQRVRLPWKSKNIIKPEPVYTDDSHDLSPIIQDIKPIYNCLSVVVDDATGWIVQEILTQEYILNDAAIAYWQKQLQQRAEKKAAGVPEDNGHTVQAIANKPCMK